MVIKNSLKLWAILSLLIISACGPIYDTEYNYQPPRSDFGRMCINNCLSLNESCVDRCEMQKANCFSFNLLRHQNNYFIEREGFREGYRGRDWGYRDRFLINQNNFTNDCEFERNNCVERCNDSHRMCYRNCGGIILERQVCKAFCKG